MTTYEVNVTFQVSAISADAAVNALNVFLGQIVVNYGDPVQRYEIRSTS